MDIQISTKWRIWFAFVAIVGLLIWLRTCCAPTKQNIVIKEKTALQHPQVKPTKVYKDSQGDTHVQIPAASNQVNQSSLKDTSVTNHALLDSTAKQLKIKDAQIAELTRVNLQLNEAIQLTPMGDSVFSYTDQHLKLTYYALTKKAMVNYHVAVTMVKYTPASFLPFSTKPAVLDFSTDDPRAIVGEIDHNSIVASQPFIGFGVAAKANYLFDTRKVIPGMGASLRLGRWHVNYDWYYDSALKQSVGGAYDIVKINP